MVIIPALDTLNVHRDFIRVSENVSSAGLRKSLNFVLKAKLEQKMKFFKA